MSIEVTEAELMQAIADAMAEYATPDDPPGAFRSIEVAETMVWSQKRVQAALHRLDRAGKLRRCKVWRTDLAGRRMPMPAYQLVD
jgi:hypothetical protein